MRRAQITNQIICPLRSDQFRLSSPKVQLERFRHQMPLTSIQSHHSLLFFRHVPKFFVSRAREFMRVLSNEYPSGLIVQIEQQKNDVSNQSFRSKQFNPSTTPMILRVGCAVEYIESLESYRVGLKFQIMIFNCPYFPLIRGTTNAHFPDGISGGCRCYNTYETTTSMKHTDSPKTASFTTTPKVTLS